ncbi:hypothetical protein Cantr_09164 [Candida viswanathii]|uniref:Uncharacterized protein n=1 Tax=Candida viswanathii TaxID=5486 RepID=A0A367Y9P4_9ASCO|nr:hypothetical protein Cantr_09164 [Candida viswanathii]
MPSKQKPTKTGYTKQTSGGDDRGDHGGGGVRGGEAHEDGRNIRKAQVGGHNGNHEPHTEEGRLTAHTLSHRAKLLRGSGFSYSLDDVCDEDDDGGDDAFCIIVR